MEVIRTFSPLPFWFPLFHVLFSHPPPEMFSVVLCFLPRCRCAPLLLPCPVCAPPCLARSCAPSRRPYAARYPLLLPLSVRGPGPETGGLRRAALSPTHWPLALARCALPL